MNALMRGSLIDMGTLFLSGDKLTRASACGFRNYLAAQQARDFIDSGLLVQTIHMSVRAVRVGFLADPVIGVSAGGDLRQMGDADDLMRR